MLFYLFIIFFCFCLKIVKLCLSNTSSKLLSIQGMRARKKFRIFFILVVKLMVFAKILTNLKRIFWNTYRFFSVFYSYKIFYSFYICSKIFPSSWIRFFYFFYNFNNFNHFMIQHDSLSKKRHPQTGECLQI